MPWETILSAILAFVGMIFIASVFTGIMFITRGREARIAAYKRGLDAGVEIGQKHPKP